MAPSAVSTKGGNGLAQRTIQFIGTPSWSDAFARSKSSFDRGWSVAKRSRSASWRASSRARSSVFMGAACAALTWVHRAISRGATSCMMAGMPIRPRLVPLLMLVAILAACGGATGSPGPASNPATTEAPATQAPSASAPPPPSEAPPTQEPAPADAGGPYAEALVAKLAADPLVLHLEQVATATTPVGEVEATLSGDFSGNNLDLTMQLTTAGGGVDMDMVIVDETAYVRQRGDADWTSVPRDVAEAEIAGLVQNMRLVTDPLDLSYVGPEVVDGRDLHHLTASRAIPYAPGAGGTGQYDVFDIWIEEDGTPVLAKTAFSATDPTGVEVSGTTNFEFS